GGRCPSYPLWNLRVQMASLLAPRTDAGDRVRPRLRARAERPLAQTGTGAATTPIRFAPGGHGLAGMDDSGTHRLAGDAHLAHGVATQLGTTRRGRAAGDTR